MRLRDLFEAKWEARRTLPAGAVLYHGTHSMMKDGSLRFPAWFTGDLTVAEHFADSAINHLFDEAKKTNNYDLFQKLIAKKRRGFAGFLVTYHVQQPIDLCYVNGTSEMAQKFEPWLGADRGNNWSLNYHHMVEPFMKTGEDGWYIDHSYAYESEDILLVDSSKLRYIDCRRLPALPDPKFKVRY